MNNANLGLFIRVNYTEILRVMEEEVGAVVIATGIHIIFPAWMNKLFHLDPEGYSFFMGRLRMPRLEDNENGRWN